MRHGRRILWSAAVALAAIVLGGCSLGPKATEQPASYDLGAPRAAAAGGPAIAATLAVPEVTAPAWLSGNGIVYRLSYDSAERARVYTLSRWMAPPPALITERLRSRFAAAAASGIVTSTDGGVRADYMLRVELEDFSQSFDTPALSRVAVRARASLISLTTRALVAQREFALEQAAPTADAPGGVQALSAASGDLVEGVLQWTAEQLRTAKNR